MSLFERIQNKRYDLQEKKREKKFPEGDDGKVNFNKNKNKNKNKKTGGFEDITGEGPNVNPPKTRKELEVKRKEYEIDPKTNQPSKAGVEKYARKMKQSNLPLTQDDLDKAKRRMVGGEPIYKADKKYLRQVGTTTGKYGGRLGEPDKKIAKMTDAEKAANLAKVKAKIDAKNPVIQTPVGPLPKTAKNMKKFSKRTRFKNFASKQSSKAFKYLKGAAARNPLVAGAIGLGALYYGGQAIKKALGPKTLTNKDFSSTAPIKDRSGQNVRFKYDKKAENIAKPYLTSKSLKKFKSGDYNVATKSGKPINVNQNMKQSAFEKQIQKAQKNPKNKKNQQFLKKFKNATRPT